MVTGAEVVTDWTEAVNMADGIMEADISGLDIETDYTQLFANGENQMMARHPNNVTGDMMEPMNPESGYALLSNVYKDAGAGASGYATFEGTTIPDVDLTGGIFRGMTGKMRNYVYGTVSASSGSTLTFTAINKGAWKNEAAISNTQHKFGWGFVLHKNLIDVPGEWFADNNKLYYLPHEGQNMDSTRIEIQVRERVLVLNNTSGVTVKGINFIAGNVDMQNTSGASISDCTMRYLYPFWTPLGYGQNDTDKKGVYLENSSANTFKNNYIAHSWGNMFALRSCTNTQFENCVIEDFGWVGVFTSAIHVNKGDNTHINKCTFGDAGRFQVRIDGNDPTKVNIIDCDFYGSMKMGEDAGPIEATSTGRIGALNLKGSEIAYNKIHDVKGVPVSDGGYLRVKATAFYMEDTENYTAHHNLIYNIKHEGYEGPHEIEKVGEFLYLGPRYNPMYNPVNYYNNTIWNVDENIGIWNIEIDNWEELGLTPPDTTGFMKDGHFANNIFMNGPGYKMSYNRQVISSTGARVDWATSPAGASIQTTNFDEYTKHCANWGYQFNPETNQFFDFEDAAENFVDAANGDFTLLDGSQAVGTGTELEGFTGSSAPDCGALEGSNRVLLAGANLTIPNFKEEGTNAIPETEWIKYVDFPEEFIDTTTVFELKLAYNVFGERDIVVSFRTPEDTYITQGRKTVQPGSDTISITVQTEQTQNIDNDYIFMAALRPKGGAWNENIFTHTLTADIVSVLTSVGALFMDTNLLLFPNPARNMISIRGLYEAGEDLNIRIYSLDGKNVIAYPGSGAVGDLEIDISNLSPGMYFVHIENYPGQKLKFIKNNF
ncbi:T9SS type A sorting domain-containing protein [uncultured Draconibacterium sp.]|uniref:T9SS type A sorting domain-containing protein n=1 Tax=uncultured Draconibacterium sp. TaxID=1573823 RepID=UPI0032604D1D